MRLRVVMLFGLVVGLTHPWAVSAAGQRDRDTMHIRGIFGLPVWSGMEIRGIVSPRFMEFLEIRGIFTKRKQRTNRRSLSHSSTADRTRVGPVLSGSLFPGVALHVRRARYGSSGRDARASPVER